MSHRLLQLINNSIFYGASRIAFSQAIAALSGFIFWAVVAIHTTTSDIGNASALVNIGLIVSQICLLGLNQAIFRTNSIGRYSFWRLSTLFIFFFVALMCIVVFFQWKSHAQYMEFLPLLIFSMGTSGQIMAESFLISMRKPNVVMCLVMIFSIVKIVLFISLNSLLSGNSAITYSLAVSVFTTWIIETLWIRRHLKTAQKPSLISLKSSWRFAIATYFSGLAWMGNWTLVTPLVLANSDSVTAGKFSLSLMPVMVILTIFAGIAQIIFAESNNIKKRKSSMWKPIIFGYSVAFLSAILITFLVVHFLLPLLVDQGEEKEVETIFLNLLFVVFLSSFNLLVGAVLKIENRVKILSLSYLSGFTVFILVFQISSGSAISRAVIALISGQSTQLLFATMIYLKVYIGRSKSRVQIRDC
jgi:O-antigen/teichoic acid export membrane protein